MTARARRLCDDEHGAVLVETLVVLVPVLGFFFGALQLTEVATGDLVMQRAASAAARAAIVVLPDSDEYYDAGVNDFSGERSEEIHEAARMILRTNSSFDADSAVVSISPTEINGNDPLTATVSARFRCGVMCFGGSVRLSANATYTYQGAQYVYEYFTGPDFNPVR